MKKEEKGTGISFQKREGSIYHDIYIYYIINVYKCLLEFEIECSLFYGSLLV